MELIAPHQQLVQRVVLSYETNSMAIDWVTVSISFNSIIPSNEYFIQIKY